MAGRNLRNIFFMIYLIFFSVSYGQTEIEINQSIIYDENVFRNYLELPDWITQTNASISHFIPIHTSQFRIQYFGNLNTFNDFNERLFHTHDLSLTVAAPVIENLTLHAGANFQIRKNKTEYDIYDYSYWLVNGDMVLNKWRSAHFQAGFLYKNKELQNLPAFSFEESAAYLRMRFFLPTRTTILAQLNYGAKNYVESQTVEELVITKDVMPYGGKGQGRRHGNPPMESDTAIVANNLSIPKTQQWNLQIKFAQSIFRTTGAGLEYLRRFEPAQSTRYLSGQGYAYTKDDELFDDPFTYSSHEWYFTVTQLLPRNFTLKINASLADKKFMYSAVTDTLSYSESSETRNDRQRYIGASLNKKISLKWFIREMNIYASYFYLINESNDLYFDSRGSVISLGSNLKF